MSLTRSIAALITYHNERGLLTDCLDSLLSQTTPVDEIIVYDDASVDLATHYVPAGAPVRVINSATNRGPAIGRNVLLEASTSDYIHFHDADDLFNQRWCERLRAVISASDPDVVFTEIESSRCGVPVSSKVLDIQRLATPTDLVRFCLRSSLLTPSGTYRRDLVKAIGGYRAELWQSEDFDFHVRLAAQRPTFAVINEPLVHIRVGTGRSCDQVEVWTSALQAIEALSHELPTDYRDDLADAAARAGSELFDAGARMEAQEAFAVALRLGRPSFGHRPDAYRVIARTFGPLTAERVAAAYRGLLPEPVRRRARR